MITNTNNVCRYLISGNTYAITYGYWDKSTIKVYLTQTSGSLTLLTLGTDYTLTDPNGVSGTLTKVSDWGTATKITIIREVALTQEKDLINGQTIDAETLEEAFDLAVAQIQQVSERQERGVQFPVDEAGSSTTLPNKAARIGSGSGTILGFNSTGEQAIVRDLAQFDADVASAASNATAAANSASSAATSATTASTKASEASASATNAATSEAQALSYKNAAETAEANAETAETNAETAETNAEAAQVAAEAAQQKIENMTATASQVAEGGQPTVTKTEVGGVVNLAFGIPKGDTGEAAGFGTPTARATQVAAGGSPTVAVSASGASTSKVFDFTFGIPKGDQGEAGEGVPTGGNAGQFLKKKSATDYDTEWANSDVTFANITGSVSDNTELVNTFNTKVSTTTKVNNKNLEANITLDGADIKATGYTKATQRTSIQATDSINVALGKLEYKCDNTPGGATSWGNISGTLSDQTDLNTALGTKLNKAVPTTEQGTKEFLYTFAGTTQNTDVALINDMSSEASSYTDKMVATALSVVTELDKKVVKVTGKGLSTNDYDATEKQKVTDAYTDKHTHSNKALLDTYTQTEANLSDAVSKKHEHSNKTELDLIASGDKAKWDAKSVVSVASTGTATDEVKYITVNGTEKKLAGGSGGHLVGEIWWASYDLSAEDTHALVCNGQAVSRTTYATLYSKIALGFTPEYSSSSTYAVGDYAVHDSELYTCSTAITTAEAWDSSHWTIADTVFQIPNLTDSRFIEGASSGIGNKLSAGLPNIRGGFGLHNSAAASIIYSLAYAFSGDGGSSSKYRTPYQLTESSGSRSYGSFNLDASTYNSIYGNSSTVQPTAMKLLPMITY